MEQTKNRHPIAPYNLEGICKIIAETSVGLTGSEIGKILADVRIADNYSSLTKWKRLYNAFAEYQNLQNSSSGILVFLCHAMHPSRYQNNSEIFYSRLNELNKQLSFIGYEITETGKFRVVEKSNTLSEAEQRASHFKHKLETRNAHKEIFNYCKPELLTENYFHSVFESVKSIAERIRQMTNIQEDGMELVEFVFSLKNPLIRINQLADANDRSEHQGLANTIKGLFGMIRNPTAHRPKLTFNIEEEYALDLITVVSLVHKKLDQVIYP